MRFLWVNYTNYNSSDPALLGSGLLPGVELTIFINLSGLHVLIIFYYNRLGILAMALFNMISESSNQQHKNSSLQSSDLSDLYSSPQVRTPFISKSTATNLVETEESSDTSSTIGSLEGRKASSHQSTIQPALKRRRKAHSVKSYSLSSSKHVKVRRSDEDKTIDILAYMSQSRMTIPKFLQCLALHRRRRECAKPFKTFKQFAYSTATQEDGFLDTSDWSAIMEGGGWAFAANAIHKEVETLCQTPTYGVFRQSDRDGSIGELSEFITATERSAPRLTSLLARVSHSSRKNDQEPEFKHNKSLIVICSLLCHTLHRNSSSAFQTILGLFLHNGGAKRYVIEALNKLGLSVSYKVLQAELADIAKLSKDKVRDLGRSPLTIATYDNFEYSEGKRGERTGDLKTKVKSITTALIFNGNLLPEGGLKQAMWKPHIPIKAVDIVQGVRRTKTFIQVIISILDIIQ